MPSFVAGSDRLIGHVCLGALCVTPSIPSCFPDTQKCFLKLPQVLFPTPGQNLTNQSVCLPVLGCSCCGLVVGAATQAVVGSLSQGCSVLAPPPGAAYKSDCWQLPDHLKNFELAEGVIKIQ
jgi:hypothetical protein